MRSDRMEALESVKDDKSQSPKQMRSPKRRVFTKEEITEKIHKMNFNDIQKLTFEQLNSVSKPEEKFKPETMLDIEEVDEHDEILSKFVLPEPMATPNRRVTMAPKAMNLMQPKKYQLSSNKSRIADSVISSQELSYKNQSERKYAPVSISSPKPISLNPNLNISDGTSIMSQPISGRNRNQVFSVQNHNIGGN